jgi:hypothetical protein
LSNISNNLRINPNSAVFNNFTISGHPNSVRNSVSKNIPYKNNFQYLNIKNDNLLSTTNRNRNNFNTLSINSNGNAFKYQNSNYLNYNTSFVNSNNDSNSNTNNNFSIGDEKKLGNSSKKRKEKNFVF